MVKKVVGIIVLIILLPILFINGVILVDSLIHPDEIPGFFEWKPFIVLSSSMESEIYSGDLAIVKEVDTKEIKKNDIIAFQENGIVITHRVVDIVEEEGETRYVTKGDNNEVADNDLVKPEQVEGVYIKKISRLGNLAMFMQTPVGMVVSLSIPILLLLIVQKIENDKNRKAEKEFSDKEKDLQEEIERLKRQNEELSKK